MPPRKRSPKKAAPASTLGRPDFWNPEWFLAWRAENPTIPILAQYRRWAAEWGTTEWSIRCEIRRWKIKVEGFRDRLAAIDPDSNRPDRGRILAENPGLETWHIDFLVALGEFGGDRKAAAESVPGLKWETIRKKLQVGGAEFDKALYEAVVLYDQGLVERTRSIIPDAIEMAYEQEDPKTLERLAFGVLERREPELWAKNQNVNVSGHVEHEHTVARQRAMSEAGEISRGLFQHRGEPPALPAGDVIEGCYVVIEQKEGEHVR